MKRPAIVWVDDPKATHVEVISLIRKDGAEDMVGECHIWPVTADDQLRHDVDLVTDGLYHDDEWEEARHRLGARFQLDEKDEAT